MINNKNLIRIVYMLCIMQFATATNTTASNKKRKSYRFSHYLTNTGAIITGIGINSVLDYISTFMHEHGHGIASNGPYTIEIIPAPLHFHWAGVTSFTDPAFNYNNECISTLAGPITGILTTYLQCITLKLLKGYINKKSLRKSFFKGIILPFSFFKKRIKIGKQYTNSLLNNKQSFKKHQRFSSKLINNILWLRIGRIVAETIYGLLPYELPLNEEKHVGDGEKIWKALLGPECPTFRGKLIFLALGVMTTPYIIGASQAVYEKCCCHYSKRVPLNEEKIQRN